MFESLLITFREGLEAFLIVAITVAYLQKTQRQHLLPAVWAGIAVAFVLSATTGWHIKELAEDEVFEGSMAMVAGLMVASFTVYIMRNAHRLRGEIGAQLEVHAQRAGPLAVAGVFIFTVLMIAREGMETALMLGTLSAQTNSIMLIAGALMGLCIVGAVGILWVSQSHTINLKLFLQVTGVFLVLFSAHLFIYGIHELSEMGMIPLVDNITLHEMTEPFGHNSVWGQMITYGLLAVPCAWLLFSWLREKMMRSKNQAAG
ncbi:MAG: iron permease FTR1 [Alphaproteobacteria bacterium]|nr:iron permease FTR1 [Alphaproteobacteria bacterium]